MGLLAFIILFDFFAINKNFIHPIDLKEYFPEEGFVNFLKNDHDIFRVYTLTNTKSTFIPRRLQMDKIANARGMVNLPIKRYSDIMANSRGNLNLLSLLNVKYILSTQELSYPQLNLVYNDAKMNIYQNKEVLPRAFFVEKVEITEEDVLSKVIDPQFDFKNNLILEQPISDKIESNALEIQNTVDIITYSTNKVLLKANVQKANFLVLTDVFFPGWKTFVDGQETKIYKADYIFRSIFLEKGEHTVEFVYDPLSFKLGMWISFITIGIVLMAMLKIYRKKLTG